MLPEGVGGYSRKHIKKIVYAKNEICVTLYSPTPCEKKNNQRRSFSCPHPTKAFTSSKCTQKNTNPITNDRVRNLNLAPRLQELHTLDAIFPNKLHSCKGKIKKLQKKVVK